MHLALAPRPSLDALDQWGIEFLLLPEEFEEFDAVDQWGIEFPFPDGEFATPARYGGRGRLQARSYVLGVRPRAISQAGAWAAILAIVIAGSALAISPSLSAGAAPPSGAPTDGQSTGGQPVVIGGADFAQIGSLPSITEPLPTILIPALEPTPGGTSPAVLEAPSFQVRPTVVPTIEDAKSYLVARLGSKAERHWGMAQSQCASLIFEEEAQWNPHATNKTSGAYGLPQAKPVSKLANWAEAKAKAAEESGDLETALLYLAWRDNPVAQAEWGVDYMIDRYGSPCAALTFRNGYWKNGVLIPGVGWY
jgi:hypothetical protein